MCGFKPRACGLSCTDGNKPVLPAEGGLKETAQSYMSKMTPEQIEEIRKTIENMSDEEKKNIVKTLTQQFNPKNH